MIFPKCAENSLFSSVSFEISNKSVMPKGDAGWDRVHHLGVALVSFDTFKVFLLIALPIATIYHGNNNLRKRERFQKCRKVSSWWLLWTFHERNHGIFGSRS